ncbi:hypothetical protein BBK36DRAFT_1166347 [Trichoderma citrinoviride]|uniref:Uncharacterized protein n=1 Tax=Trichoderma citrinoviride TaxID=58853 RepID=A0A2T4BGI2_9HYPO|nr:hypothetical protein BBK36DRAFT_1166347 [Trichoderma citrinoviride]PTB68433.1 hypothetical protein BBK36DRAFT_1166347 [Trichoderma citrinoviride]
MGWLSRLSAAAALATTALAAEASTSSKTSTAAEPCAQIAKLVKAGTSTFSSQVTLACLQSTPFKSDLAVSFIDEVRKYLEWHSTTEILRNPPPTSLSATVDLLGGLSNIRDRASANAYKSQYDFDADLFHLFSFANDGHLGILPCSIVLVFESQLKLVSISSDGIEVPRLYTLGDGKLLAQGNKDVSPVTLINGVGAEAYTEQLSETAGLQDPDARYNSMMTNVPIGRDGSTTLGGYGAFATFPGAHEFNVTYANGTEQSIPLNGAIGAGLKTEFTFQTGDALWDAVCKPQPASSDDSSKKKRADSSSSAKELPAPETYPKPTVKDPFNLITGYLPDDKGLEDVAVLTVPTFLTQDAASGIPTNEIANFALEAQEFVQKAIAAGRSKIIIDVTNNPGGSVDSGFGLVSVFFPNMTIFSATRYRSTPGIQFVTEAFSRASDAAVEEVGLHGTPFFVPDLVQPDQKTTFKSVEDFLGPFDVLGVPSTAIVAEDNFALTNETQTPINIFGQGGILNGTTPPYAPENIVILTDGQCSSTCTIFVNHMIPYGVRVVTTGGRPQAGPMQSIGGVKGAQVLELSDISLYSTVAQQLVQNATDAKKPLFTDKEMSVFSPSIPLALEDLPLRLTTGSVNFRNAFSPFDDQTPTHFVYQAADCRLFYTAEALIKPEALWVNVADSVWGGGDCVFTSVPQKAIKSAGSKTESSKAAATSAASGSTDETDDDEQETQTPAPKKKKTKAPAHKALGLLLAMAEGLRG